jgi:hypothetical protein
VERLRLVLDVSRDTSPDPESRTPIRHAAFGLTYALTREADLGLGVRRSYGAADERRALPFGVKPRW